MIQKEVCKLCTLSFLHIQILTEEGKQWEKWARYSPGVTHGGGSVCIHHFSPSSLCLTDLGAFAFSRDDPLDVFFPFCILKGGVLESTNCFFKVCFSK